jgi:hypothetical protein
MGTGLGQKRPIFFFFGRGELGGLKNLEKTCALKNCQLALECSHRLIIPGDRNIRINN